MKNLTLDLDEEAAIKSNASVTPSQRSDRRRGSFYRGPKPFRVFDCATLFAVLSGLTVFMVLYSLMMTFLPHVSWDEVRDFFLKW